MFSYVPYFSEGSYPLALGLQHRLEGDIPSSIDIKYEVYLLYLLRKQSLSMQHQLMVLLLSQVLLCMMN